MTAIISGNIPVSTHILPLLPQPGTLISKAALIGASTTYSQPRCARRPRWQCHPPSGSPRCGRLSSWHPSSAGAWRRRNRPASGTRGRRGSGCSPGFSTWISPCHRDRPPPALPPASCHPAQKGFSPSRRWSPVFPPPPGRKSNSGSESAWEADDAVWKGGQALEFLRTISRRDVGKEKTFKSWCLSAILGRSHTSLMNHQNLHISNSWNRNIKSRNWQRCQMVMLLPLFLFAK